MKICSTKCPAHCEFCAWSIRDTYEEDGITYDCGHMGCVLDIEGNAHEDAAYEDGYCEDFKCFKYDDAEQNTRLEVTKEEYKELYEEY